MTHRLATVTSLSPRYAKLADTLPNIIKAAGHFIFPSRQFGRFMSETDTSMSTGVLKRPGLKKSFKKYIYIKGGGGGGEV